MATEIRALEPLELWNRPYPGHVAPWVGVVVVVASAITIALAAIGPQLLSDFERTRIGDSGFCLKISLVIAVVVALVVIAARSYAVSRLMQLAVALPIVHGVAMVAVWFVLEVLTSSMPRLEKLVPLLGKLSIPILLVLFGLGAFAVALAVARRRQREMLQAFVTMTLAHVLVLGLWLPIASRMCGDGKLYWDEISRQVPSYQLVFVLMPPFMTACVATAVVMRWPRVLRIVRWPITALLVVFVVASFITRVTAQPDSIVFYGHFTHALLVAVLVATVALAMLAVANAWRQRVVGDGCHDGVIVDDGEPVVGCIHVPSWLRGPRPLLRSFELETASGRIAVPGGRLHGNLPLLSSALHSGEAVVTLRAGEHVLVTGYLTRDDSDHPFRESAAPVPGPNGLDVVPLADEPSRGTHVALALWRPSVAYLLIVSVISLPSIVLAMIPGRFY